MQARPADFVPPLAVQIPILAGIGRTYSTRRPQRHIQDFSVFPFGATVPPARAHFSYGAAADECSIWGIIAAAFPAARSSRVASRPALIWTQLSNLKLKDALPRQRRLHRDHAAPTQLPASCHANAWHSQRHGSKTNVEVQFRHHADRAGTRLGTPEIAGKSAKQLKQLLSGSR